MIPELRPLTLQDAPTLTQIWNRACEELTVGPRMFEYLMHTPQEFMQEGRVAFGGERAVGFILASAVPDSSGVVPPEVGWIDALAVEPEFRRRGLGGALLRWAETWLKEGGATKAALGGGLRPLVPGLPERSGPALFFRQRGYEVAPDPVWDVAADLGEDSGNTRPEQPDVSSVPAQAAHLDELQRFLLREFPGRWSFEFREFLREGGRPGDYMLLLQGPTIQGFARMTFADSEQPLDRFFMHRLPEPWAQLGPIGISGTCRDRGFGQALVRAALEHFRQRGIRGCLIDWTTDPNFYRRFGFNEYRSYLLLSKQLA